MPGPAARPLAVLLCCATLAAVTGGCGSLFTPAEPGSAGDPAWDVPKDAQRRTVELANKSSVPLLVVRFDRDGRLLTPESAAAAVAAVKEPGVTDVYVLCPGWESAGWESAVGWAESFVAGYERVRFAASVPAAPDTRPARAYHPVYVLALWPADAGVERFPGPDGSARPRPTPPASDRDAANEVLLGDVPPRTVARLKAELTARGHGKRARQLGDLLARTGNGAGMTPPDQVDLAECLLPLYGPQEEPAAPGPRYAAASGREPARRIEAPRPSGLLATDPPSDPPIDPLALLDVWKRMAREASAAAAPRADGDAARRLLPVAELVRWALRATDLRVSKDWAFKVGRNGLADVLAGVRAAAPAAPVHLVGHSHGCEVLLAAVTRRDKPVDVDSVLLLEPIVSSWALAPAPQVGQDVAAGLQKHARPGDYRSAAEGRVRRSIIATYSEGDWVTSQFAPRAVRRPTIDGMASPDSWAGAGAGFAQLGAVGFGGTDATARRTPIIPVPGPGGARPERYPHDAAPEGVSLLGVDATGTLRAHGEVNGPTYWWILADQVELTP